MWWKQFFFFFLSFSTETWFFDSFLRLCSIYAVNFLLLTPDSDSAGKNTIVKYSLHPRTDSFFFCGPVLSLAISEVASCPGELGKELERPLYVGWLNLSRFLLPWCGFVSKTSDRLLPISLSFPGFPSPEPDACSFWWDIFFCIIFLLFLSTLAQVISSIII